jgi:hypothetical protein
MHKLTERDKVILAPKKLKVIKARRGILTNMDRQVKK